MKAVRIHEDGSPDVLRYEDVDDPSDPEAARSGDEAPGDTPLADLMDSGGSKGASDPMPDMSGTTEP